MDHDLDYDMDEDELNSQSLFSMCMSLHARIDVLWQRLIFSHAAIIGVMIFFGSTEDPYLVPRILVFLVYTINLVITLVATFESYRGLQAGLEDLRAQTRGRTPARIETWLMGLDYRAHPRRRVVMFAVIWGLIAYLFFSRFFLG